MFAVDKQADRWFKAVTQKWQMGHLTVNNVAGCFCWYDDNTPSLNFSKGGIHQWILTQRGCSADKVLIQLGHLEDREVRQLAGDISVKGIKVNALIFNL